MARVIGFELNSPEPEKAAEFYSKVFNWEISEPKWDYRSVSTGEITQYGIDGGIAKGPSDYPHGTRIQVEVDCMDEVLVTAKNNGAMILREKMEFNEFYLSYLIDPTGICIGLIEKKKRMY
ncbi:VOC family protein [Bacillus sp. B1-b2]|uniref:VOC family protein n=1 Tax=Bacillus sp. B1-b2 TaxID=2653201 RepID=UPI001261B6BA|nr:hypothetical protein [Bacillus sp. B1-b2]KAB7667137.1 hypothetical protein F9279_16210 [Bacillus sp. B1-b2]